MIDDGCRGTGQEVIRRQVVLFSMDRGGRASGDGGADRILTLAAFGSGAPWRSTACTKDVQKRQALRMS